MGDKNIDIRYKIFSKYLPKINDRTLCPSLFENYENLLSEIKSSFKILGRKFMTNVLSVDMKELLHKDILLSGVGCFFGSCIMSYLQTGTIKNINGILDFTIIYMIFDHYGDDPNIKDGDKKKLIALIKRVLDNPNCECPGYDKRSQTLVKYFRRIIIRQPKVKSYIYQAVYAEITSVAVQEYKCPSIILFEMAKWKGGTTIQAIQAILELPVTNDEYMLGTCIQFVDDIYDIEDDLQDNIYTVATSYAGNNKLDELFLQTADYIDKLPEKYNMCKIILLTVLIHSCNVHDYFSLKCQKQIYQYLWMTDDHEALEAIHQYMLTLLK